MSRILKPSRLQRGKAEHSAAPSVRRLVWFCICNCSIFSPTISWSMNGIDHHLWRTPDLFCDPKVKIKLWFWALHRLFCLTPINLSYNDTAYTCWQWNEEDPIHFMIKNLYPFWLQLVFRHFWNVKFQPFLTIMSAIRPKRTKIGDFSAQGWNLPKMHMPTC